VNTWADVAALTVNILGLVAITWLVARK